MTPLIAKLVAKGLLVDAVADVVPGTEAYVIKGHELMRVVLIVTERGFDFLVEAEPHPTLPSRPLEEERTALVELLRATYECNRQWADGFLHGLLYENGGAS